MAALQTHHSFTLPRGYVDRSGELHADGVMRLATARDEIEPLRDPEVRRNDAYLSVLLLSRTVIRIGAITEVTPNLIEELFAADFDHLQRLYERLNTAEPTAEALQDLPAVIPALGSQQPQRPSPSLPLSGEATRWLTRGEVPADLVPLLGDPAFPNRPAAPEEPQQARPPWLDAELEQGPREGSPDAPQVIARIVEGAPMPSAATPSAAPSEDRVLPSWDHAEALQPSASIEELPGAHRDTPPLLRLARSPAQRSRALEQPGPAVADVGLASAIPISPALRRQLGDLDIEELYEAFLHRLRRDLLHDRERLGDLLGPLR